MISLSYLVYGKLIYRGKRIDSSPFDELAQRMGALPFMHDKRGRYFLSKARISAVTLGSMVFFGAAYWSHLDDDERLAIAAHEFVHIRSVDSMNKARRVLLPAVIIAGAISLFMAFTLRNFLNGGVLLVGVLFAMIAFLFALAGSTLASAGWNRRNELRCDVEGARYVDGEAMIRALELWESSVSERHKKTFAYRLASRSYPTLAERRSAISEVMRIGTEAQ